MSRVIVAVAMLFTVTVIHASSFCEGAQFVAFDELVRSKDGYLNMRIRTHGVLSTDGKEFSLLKQEERSIHGLLVENDSEADKYAREHTLHTDASFDLVADFTSKLQQQEGSKAPSDMSKIGSYRQQLALCGRVIKGSFGYGFAIDDSILERTYLIRRKKR